jgi:AhpD family alkylhydroperoxidase
MGRGAAMTRLPYPGPPAGGADADVQRRIAADRGEVLAIYRMLMHAPGIADGWRHLLTQVRREAELSGRLRELVVMRVAALNGAAYEADHHRPIARAEGVSDAELAVVADRLVDVASSALFDDVTTDVLVLTDSLTRDVRVDDAVLGRLAERLGSRQVVELVVTIGAYNMVSRFLVAFDIVDET